MGGLHPPEGGIWGDNGQSAPRGGLLVALGVSCEPRTPRPGGSERDQSPERSLRPGEAGGER